VGGSFILLIQKEKRVDDQKIGWTPRQHTQNKLRLCKNNYKT
jgi:hypothetical protein